MSQTKANSKKGQWAILKEMVLTLINHSFFFHRVPGLTLPYSVSSDVERTYWYDRSLLRGVSQPYFILRMWA